MQVRLLDILVLKLDDPVVDVEQVTLNRELLWRFDWVALPIQLDERDLRVQLVCRRILEHPQDADFGSALVDLQQLHRSFETIDFLLSEQVERMLAESVSHNVPLRPGLAAHYPQYVVADPLSVDYRRAAAGLQGAVEQAMRRLARGSDAP